MEKVTVELDALEWALVANMLETVCSVANKLTRITVDPGDLQSAGNVAHSVRNQVWDQGYEISEPNAPKRRLLWFSR